MEKGIELVGIKTYDIQTKNAVLAATHAVSFKT